MNPTPSDPKWKVAARRMLAATEKALGRPLTEPEMAAIALAAFRQHGGPGDDP